MVTKLCLAQCLSSVKIAVELLTGAQSANLGTPELLILEVSVTCRLCYCANTWILVPFGYLHLQ